MKPGTLVKPELGGAYPNYNDHGIGLVISWQDNPGGGITVYLNVLWSDGTFERVAYFRVVEA